MNGTHDPGSTAALARLADQGASAAQIAEALLDAWQGMHEALAPVIGQRGVAALFSRALHVTGNEFPWMAAAPLDAAGTINLAALRAAVAARHRIDAASASDAFLHHFNALLSSLIGQSLTDQLIGTARIDTAGGPAAQDT